MVNIIMNSFQNWIIILLSTKLNHFYGYLDPREGDTTTQIMGMKPTGTIVTGFSSRKIQLIVVISAQQCISSMVQYVAEIENTIILPSKTIAKCRTQIVIIKEDGASLTEVIAWSD